MSYPSHHAKNHKLMLDLYMFPEIPDILRPIPLINPNSNKKGERTAWLSKHQAAWRKPRKPSRATPASGASSFWASLERCHTEPFGILAAFSAQGLGLDRRWLVWNRCWSGFPRFLFALDRFSLADVRVRRQGQSCSAFREKRDWDASYLFCS